MSFVTSGIVKGPVILEKFVIAPTLAYGRIHPAKQFTGQLGGEVKMQKNGPVLPAAHIIQRPTNLGLTLKCSPALFCTLECKLGDKEAQDSCHISTLLRIV